MKIDPLTIKNREQGLKVTFFDKQILNRFETKKTGEETYSTRRYVNIKNGPRDEVGFDRPMAKEDEYKFPKAWKKREFHEEEST